MQEKTAVSVSPAQAQWIVERLIADRRISAADVRSLLSGLEQEIRDIEQRLSGLRDAAGPTAVASPAPRSEAPAAKTRKRQSRKKKGHPRGIAGTLSVLLRSIPAAEHAAIAAIRADKGIKSAIKAAKAAAKTG
jgi:Arc/MetJ-type ribon-helix-helix transcriptional regulator